jgi:hypothetical protein
LTVVGVVLVVHFLVVVVEGVFFGFVSVGFVDQREGDKYVDNDNTNHNEGDDDKRSHPSRLAISPRPTGEFVEGVKDFRVAVPELVVLGAYGGSVVVGVVDVVGGVEGVENTTVGIVRIGSTNEGEHTNYQKGEKGLERSRDEDGTSAPENAAVSKEEHRRS